MRAQARQHTARFQSRLKDANIDVAVLTGEAFIAAIRPSVTAESVAAAADEIYGASG